MEKQSFSAAKIASALHNSSKGTSSQDSWESEHLAMTGCRQGLLRHCVLAFFRFPTTSLTIFGRFYACPQARWRFSGVFTFAQTLAGDFWAFFHLPKLSLGILRHCEPRRGEAILCFVDRIATALSRLAMTWCQQELPRLCIPETWNLRFHS